MTDEITPRSRGSLPPPLLEANLRGEWQWAPNTHGCVNPSVACVLARYYDRSVESGDLYLAEARGLISYLEREAIMSLDCAVGSDADARLILALADRLGVPHSDTELPPQEVA